jgi:hypothetical protein
MPRAERRSRADIADELEGAFDSWEYQLHEMQESELSQRDALCKRLLTEVPELLAPARLASHRDPKRTWAALRLGLLMGLWQAHPDAIHRRREAPDVARGQKVKGGAATGGRERWRAEEQERVQRLRTARERVTALHRDHPRRSWADICSQVGRERGLSGRTIQRYTATCRW